jgi:hypothetical protein
LRERLLDVEMQRRLVASVLQITQTSTVAD